MTDFFEDFLQKPHTRSQKCLAAMFIAEGTVTPSKIKDILKAHGLRESFKWNVSQILKDTKGLAIPVSGGWKITSKGQDILKDLGFYAEKTQKLNTLSTLRGMLSNIASAETQSFLNEAILCLESGCYRAATIMSWVAAVHILQDHVVKSHLVTFNAEAIKRDQKWVSAKNRDTLSRMGEADFLDISQKIGAIQKNVKAELKGCLDRRNACGHPNSYKIEELTACHHVETLISNVFSKY